MYSLLDRPKLFEALVKPTVLHGSATWTMTTSIGHTLWRCQRRILRMILGHRRRRIEAIHHADGELEPWVEWVKRATREAESKMEELQLDRWTTSQKRAKWSWAHRTQQLSNDKWTKIVAKWGPEQTANCSRYQVRPRRRWAGDIQSFLEEKGFHASWYNFSRVF